MYNGWMYCIEVSGGAVYMRVQDLGGKAPGIHTAVYDTYIFNYQIYSNTPAQSQREHRKR